MNQPEPHDLIEFKDGGMSVRFHPGQQRAWDETKRIVAIIAGAQSGKTSFGPAWLLREMQRKGPGDYMVVTPTSILADRKVLPSFQRLFEKKLKLGTYVNHKKKFIFSPAGARNLFGRDPDEETVVFFGHAGNPESLESATAKAAWLDEAGQRGFRLASWEAIQRRVAYHQGRILISTTPYDLGWLKQKVHDPWVEAGKEHPYIQVIRFDSTENPGFSAEEFERARNTLPPWKFDLFFRGQFCRPAGLIYDSFDAVTMKIRPCAIPDRWHRYMGLDFGGINTAAVFLAEDPDTKKLYVYREYHPRKTLTAKDHVAALLKGEPKDDLGRYKIPHAVGGSGSEDQWREEFRAAGLPVAEPQVMETAGTGQGSIVEVGINRVYAAFKNKQVYVFNTCEGLLDELESYSRELDESGEATEKIEDKSNFHHLDALRYVLPNLRKPHMPFVIGLPDAAHGQGSRIMQAPPGVFDGVDAERARKALAKHGKRDRWADEGEPDWYTEPKRKRIVNGKVID
jgi:hypothetical protein